LAASYLLRVVALIRVDFLRPRPLDQHEALKGVGRGRVPSSVSRTAASTRRAPALSKALTNPTCKDSWRRHFVKHGIEQGPTPTVTAAPQERTDDQQGKFDFTVAGNSAAVCCLLAL